MKCHVDRGNSENADLRSQEFKLYHCTQKEKHNKKRIFRSFHETIQFKNRISKIQFAQIIQIMNLIQFHNKFVLFRKKSYITVLHSYFEDFEAP